jgi:hypothetical protein
MLADLITLSRADAEALAALVAGAASNPDAPINHEAARDAVEALRSAALHTHKAIDRIRTFLAVEQRFAACTCWAALAQDDPDIPDEQYERIGAAIKV